MSRLLAGLLLLCSGCAIPPGTWRLARQGDGHVLVPPDVSRPDRVHRRFLAPVPSDHSCPDSVVSITKRGRHARVSVNGDLLAHQPPGWLAAAASRWETKGCVASGDGQELAKAIEQSLPLDPNVAFRLLYGRDQRSPGIDLDENTMLQVVSPILRDPHGELVETPTTTAGTDSSITLSAKASDNLLGYETAVYRLRRDSRLDGFRVAPVSVAFHDISTGADEIRTKSSSDLFAFQPAPAFYRMFYESWRNNFSGLVIAAATKADLERMTAKIESMGSSASCRDFDPGACAQIPSQVAVNAFVSVTVNSKEILVARGTSLSQLLRDYRASLAMLRVTKLWGGRPANVQFDSSDRAILALPLEGGERISWH